VTFEQLLEIVEEYSWGSNKKEELSDRGSDIIRLPHGTGSWVEGW
jgi:hypothetical protein